MNDEKNYFWFPLILDIIVYGVCCVMIFKRRHYTSISIRSPILLLSNILGNFFMNLIIAIFKITEENYVSSFYYWFRFMMVFSMILTYERILICCRIDKISREEEECDKKLLTEKKYLFQEKFYVRLLFIFLGTFLFIMILFKIISGYQKLFFIFNIIYSLEPNNDAFIPQFYFWVIWNFVEQFVMITYIYRILSKSFKEQIKSELFSFFILWYIYGFICTLISLIFYNGNKDYLIIISIITHYICLLLNGFLPLFLSYYNKTGISYHFSPKLMKNLYLFLSNKECYDDFSNYLYKNHNTIGLFNLKLYTHIMKFKLNFAFNNNNKNQGLNDGTLVYNTYFNNNNNPYENLIDKNVSKKVKDDYSKNNIFYPEIFDEALKNAFSELKKIYTEYNSTQEYKKLYNKLRLDSYVNCKMCNTGLINRY